MKKSIKLYSQKKKNKKNNKNNKRKKQNTRRKEGGATSIAPVKRASRNNAKIRVQFLNSRATTTPYSIISVTKGPTTGVFDYMWYNIDNIEEMLSTAMHGLKTDPPLPSEIVYNVIPNDKSDDKLNKNKNNENRLDDDYDEYGTRRDRRGRNQEFGLF
jgi:hypothetical protein